MTFFELVKKSRSYRRFDASCAVTKETLTDLIETVRFAPSSVNFQPLKYALSWEKSLNDKIFAHTRWAGLLSKEEFPPQTEEEQPTAYILIAADTEVNPNAETFKTDVGICAQTIMLAAAEKELGGCMIGSFNKAEVGQLMGLTERYVPMLLLAIGKPNETVVTEDMLHGGSSAYYRVNGVQHVPKRTANELIID